LIEITFVTILIYNSKNCTEAGDELSGRVVGIDVKDRANNAFVFLVALESRNVYQVRFRTEWKMIPRKTNFDEDHIMCYDENDVGRHACV
jgi:hypothetical protein